MTRIEEEKKVMREMITIYCRHNHKPYHGKLCATCEDLAQYAEMRLSRCPFQEGKPTCRKCTIHCYKPDMRERIRIVMRYSGPRMLWYSPAAGIRHLFRELTNKSKTVKFGGEL